MITLRDYQKDMVSRVRSGMTHNKWQLLQLATGGGKTFTAGYMINAARQKGSTCYFVVPRRELLKQTAESYASVGIPFGYIAAGHKPNPFAKVQLCTVGSLARRLDTSPAPKLMFVDETHYGTNQLDKIIQWAKANGSYGIGLSATPERTDGRGLRGFVHLKDFALKYGFNGVGNEFEIAPLLRPLLYVPPSMPIGVLLQKMQTERMHLALVIDEYGGVDGLVSIEDLIEQVVGEIEDEHDVAEGRFWTLEKPGIYLTRARTPLDEFETELGFKLLDGEDEEEIDTLGGLVFMLSGRVPARGEVVQHESGAEFEVVDADPRRIKRLRVRLPADIQKAT